MQSEHLELFSEYLRKPVKDAGFQKNFCNMKVHSNSTLPELFNSTRRVFLQNKAKNRDILPPHKIRHVKYEVAKKFFCYTLYSSPYVDTTYNLKLMDDTIEQVVLTRYNYKSGVGWVHLPPFQSEGLISILHSLLPYFTRVEGFVEESNTLYYIINGIRNPCLPGKMLKFNFKGEKE